MSQTLLHLSVHLLDALPAAPSPGPGPGPGPGDLTPQAPAFAGRFTLLLRWILWVCSMLCVLGIALIGTRLALSVRRGDVGEQVGRLGVAAAGTVVVGLASTIVSALL